MDAEALKSEPVSIQDSAIISDNSRNSFLLIFDWPWQNFLIQIFEANWLVSFVRENLHVLATPKCIRFRTEYI